MTRRYDPKALARLGKVVEQNQTGAALHVREKALARLGKVVVQHQTGATLHVKSDEWCDRFALLIDLGFFPIRSTRDKDEEQIMECVSCGWNCDESEVEQMARHSLECRRKKTPWPPKDYRTAERRHTLWLGCKIRQSRLEIGVPQGLQTLRLLTCYLTYGLLKRDQYPHFLKLFRRHFPEREKELLRDFTFLNPPDQYEI